MRLHKRGLTIEAQLYEVTDPAAAASQLQPLKLQPMELHRLELHLSWSSIAYYHVALDNQTQAWQLAQLRPSLRGHVEITYSYGGWDILLLTSQQASNGMACHS